MATFQTFEEIEAWQRARETYKQCLPDHETVGILQRFWPEGSNTQSKRFDNVQYSRRLCAQRHRRVFTLPLYRKRVSG